MEKVTLYVEKCAICTLGKYANNAVIAYSHKTGMPNCVAPLSVGDSNDYSDIGKFLPSSVQCTGFLCYLFVSYVFIQTL